MLPRVTVNRRRLAEQLASYRPADARELGFVARMQALLEQPEPFAQSSFEPGHFTASAFVLDPRRESLLLIHHHKLDAWLQPGGHVDVSDPDLEQTARRELHEEVGLDRVDLLHAGIFDVDVHVIPARKDAPAHEHFDVRFAFVAASAELGQSDEILDARWVELGRIDGVSSDGSVRRGAAKLRSLSGREFGSKP